MNEESKKSLTGLGAALKQFGRVFALPLIILLAILIALGISLWKHYTQAALVNGDPISRIEIIRQLEKEAGESMLDALVTKKLITQKAKEAGITITPQEIDTAVKTVEDRVKASGSTLDEALTQQGLTVAEFKEQVTLQKALEKLLADKKTVSPEEVKAYIDTNKIKTPAGTNEEDFKKQVMSQLENQKLGGAAQAWIAEQKKAAHIEYFVPYAPKAIEEAPLPTPQDGGTSEVSTPAAAPAPQQAQ